MAKNILSQVFPSDTAVSSLITQTRLDDVFVHCETNNKLAISTVRVVFLAALATCNPSVFDDIAAGKNTLSDAIVESNNSDLFNFRAAGGAFIKAYLAALEAKEIRRALFEGESKNDYVAFTKPNVDRILNVIAKTIADNANVFDMAKAFKGFAIIANFLSNGRIDATQADAILCSYGLVKPVAEQAQKDIEPSEAPKCEAQKPVNYEQIMAKLKDQAQNSELAKRSRANCVAVSQDAINERVAKVGDVGDVCTEAPANYELIKAKLSDQAQNSALAKRSRIAVFDGEKTNDDLLAEGKPLVNVEGYFDVYQLNGGYEFNLTTFINNYLTFIRDHLATEAGQKYVGEVSLDISIDNRYHNLKTTTTRARYQLSAFDLHSREFHVVENFLYPLEHFVENADTLKRVCFDALMDQRDNIGATSKGLEAAAKYLDLYFAQLDKLIHPQEDPEAQFDKLAYLTEEEEQKLGAYTCEINRPVATQEERALVCKGDYLQPVSRLIQSGKSYSWESLGFSSVAELCSNAGLGFNAELFKKATLTAPIFHGGEKGPLLNPVYFITGFTSTLTVDIGADGDTAHKIAMAFVRKLKKLFKKDLVVFGESDREVYIPLNAFEGGLGTDYKYDKAAHFLYDLCLTKLKKLAITKEQLLDCLGSFLKLYRAMFYIFVQDEYWRYEQDPVTQDYIFTPHVNHKSHAA